MNNRYRIRIEAPLLRPGLSIETEVSEKYVKDAAEEIMDLVRKVNAK